MNRTLERQIKRHLKGEIPSVSGWKNFIKAVDGAYEHFEEDRKLIERSLEISSRELVELNEKLKQELEERKIILDSVPAMIFYKDGTNRFIRVNKVLSKAMGISSEEMEGKSCAELYPEEQAEKYWEDDRQTMASGNPRMGIIEALKTKQGTRWVQTDKLPYRDSKGNIVGIIGFSVDITDRKKAEDELKKRADDLERFNKLMVGREIKMVELKKKIAELEKRLDQVG